MQQRRSDGASIPLARVECAAAEQYSEIRTKVLDMKEVAHIIYLIKFVIAFFPKKGALEHKELNIKVGKLSSRMCVSDALHDILKSH